MSPDDLQVRVILRLQNSLLWLRAAVENDDEDVGGSSAGDCIAQVDSATILKNVGYPHCTLRGGSGWGELKYIDFTLFLF